MGMDQYTEQLQALTEIRSMMQKSTKFLTLSGVTGIGIGIIALISAVICWTTAGVLPFEATDFYFPLQEKSSVMGISPNTFIFGLAAITILFSIIVGYYFTFKKTHKSGIQLWSKSFKLMLLNIAIPLATGGFFCIFLILRGVPEMVAPAMLIFYGLALINGGKYTLQDVNSLGISEILLGIIALYFNAYGLEFWAIGFGLFHIMYGAKIYFSQEK